MFILGPISLAFQVARLTMCQLICIVYLLWIEVVLPMTSKTLKFVSLKCRWSWAEVFLRRGLARQKTLSRMFFKLYTFRTVADATFLMLALALALVSLVLVSSTMHDHLRNYKYPALQVLFRMKQAIQPAPWMCLQYPVNLSTPSKWFFLGKPLPIHR